MGVWSIDPMYAESTSSSESLQGVMMTVICMMLSGKCWPNVCSWSVVGETERACMAMEAMWTGSRCTLAAASQPVWLVAISTRRLERETMDIGSCVISSHLRR